ncbi:deoxyribonuclease IV [Acidithrix sp. C25]|uniref:deoxyribonuclease IV n=1 Tax=Acidithrix sp. C25 TaxID=1671482 RepID=UPI00191BBEF9|nr:deoxyribonuclease IV [Acidithrix sp. C25]CAG4930455.1 unnamed protein product [Acidithrix sp. C25]
MTRLIGGHVSGAGGVAKAITRGEEIGAGVIQIFSNSPRGWKAQRISLNGFSDVAVAMAATSGVVSKIVSHASYLINLASPDPELYLKSKALLKETVNYCDEIGVESVVLHVGSHKGAGFDSALNQIVDAIDQALEGTKRVRLLLENSAGAGDSVGSSLSELALLVSTSQSVRVGLCVDTQHLFASGCDYTVSQEMERFSSSLAEKFKKDVIGAVHLNDSKSTCGSNLDRHENLGDGHIGLVALGQFVNSEWFRNVDLILETPGAGDGPRRSDVDLVQSMVQAEQN